MIRSASGHSLGSNHAPSDKDPYYQLQRQNPSPLRS